MVGNWKRSQGKQAVPGDDSSRDQTSSPKVGGHHRNPWVRVKFSIPKRSRFQSQNCKVAIFNRGKDAKRVAKRGFFHSSLVIGLIHRSIDQQEKTLTIIYLKLTAKAPGSWMVGILVSFWDGRIFRCYVSFRKCKFCFRLKYRQNELKHLIIWEWYCCRSIFSSIQQQEGLFFGTQPVS